MSEPNAKIEKPANLSGGGNDLRELWDMLGMPIVCALLFLVCLFFVENFATLKNMRGLGLTIYPIGIIACTMLFCLASGDFDISVGSNAAFSGVCAALALKWVDGHMGSQFIEAVFAIGAGVLAGMTVGLINGVIIAKIKINALITTLATMMIFRGLSLIFADGQMISLNNETFISFGAGKVMGIPVPIIYMVVCFGFFGWVLFGTVFGRNTLAIGGNREAAELAGINVDLQKLIIFIVQGAMCAIAGILIACQSYSANPVPIELLELKVIAACVLGGVSLTGGIGNMLFVVSGVLIMGILENSMNLLGVDAFWQNVVRGLILLAAVILDKFKNR